MALPLSEGFYETVERRIERLTMLVGTAAAGAVLWKWGWRAGLGVAVGAALAWLNFRWLDQGLRALLPAAGVEQGERNAPSSVWIYARFILRLALLVIALYVILKISLLPGRAILGGFFSLIAAVLLESVYQILTGFTESKPRA